MDISQTANTVELNVNQTNKAPVGRDSTGATSEDTGYTFTTGDFASPVPTTFDPSNTPANNLKEVKITTLPSGGTLKDNGATVSIGQFIPVADITVGLLVFTPNANVNGTPLSTFNFQVEDDGGTGSGGVDLSVNPNTATIVVNAVNDAPVGANGEATTRRHGLHDQGCGLRLHRSERHDPAELGGAPHAVGRDHQLAPDQRHAA